MTNGKNIIILVVLIGAMLIMKNAQPRGIRNNNPGNIREGADGGIYWQGELSWEKDTEFEEFKTPIDGIRAMARVIRTYHQLHGITTIRGIIERWAPHYENDTEAYVFYVSSRVGIHPDRNLIFPRDLTLIIEAMIYMENGIQPYKRADIIEGINRAYA